MAAAPSIQCPTCKGWIAADPRFAGQRVACPHCQGQLIMPGGGLVFHCPYCGYQGPPGTKKKISAAGWILFATLLVFCIPLCWLPFVVDGCKEEERRCFGCGSRVG